MFPRVMYLTGITLLRKTTYIISQLVQRSPVNTVLPMLAAVPSLRGLRTAARQAYFVSTSLVLPATSQLSQDSHFSHGQMVIPNLLYFCLSLYGIAIILYRYSLWKIWYDRRGLEKWGHRAWSREVQVWDGKRWGID